VDLDRNGTLGSLDLAIQSASTGLTHCLEFLTAVEEGQSDSDAALHYAVTLITFVAECGCNRRPAKASTELYIGLSFGFFRRE
jgi:hypothetical protein